MGAGSAKGVKQEENEDEVDSFSSGSSENWEESNTPPAPKKAPAAAPPGPHKHKPKPPVAPAEPPSTSTTTTSLVHIENGEPAEEKKGKPKKKFGFSLRRDQTDKVNDVNNDSSDEEEAKTERKGEKGKEKKKGGGGGGGGGGFKLFNWRKDEKKSEKDEALDLDIDDLEKTFDSLGIVGKNMWSGEEGKNGSDNTNPNKQTDGDDVLLSPMRKRRNVKKGGAGKGVMNGGGGQSGGSNASKRTFKFSWEKDKQQKAAAKDEEDEWEYKAVVIEGFDIEKFRKANLKESVFDNNSLPNVVGGEDEFEGGGGGGGRGGGGGTGGSKASSPLRYDQTEQFILAAIERDFTN
ncbi:uncharacterized protein LOC126981940 [Eriocheir sinensis]|uniref:uncharacterized protein LOC126981940 n=1 Tax=Eriocheir sinensis TaxID=95602 RepID=UPI0021C60F4D|nr:uncharacterized protein LOC126981940 [Eriocheir sinensis]XP_050689609.1 uncharacterized protein LOC126981940 [Eriocheir sinensis]